jgi:shikimate kinase
MARMENSQDNLVLIGMPGVGKSTVGVLLAKALGWAFIDTDLLIQRRTGRLLQDIIDNDGLEAFGRAEAGTVCSLDCRRSVIATGGSVIYSDPAMNHLGRLGRRILLDLHLEEIQRRVTDLKTRGLVMPAGMTLADLFEQRHDLYHRYADEVVDCKGLNQDRIVTEILHRLE